jgi:hypothetical protein
MTNGANNRIVTATGTDGMNAETNLTFDGSTLAVTGGATFTANVALGDLDYILMGATGEYQIYHDHANGVSVIKDVDAGGSINIEADSISLTGPVTATANVSLGDNDYLNIGASNDLQISHQGSDSYINEQGTGSLNILSNGTGIFLRKGVTEDMGRFNTDGAVELYHNGNKKLDTTSDGIAVTGGATFTANVSLGDNDYLRFGASNDLQIYHNGSNSIIKEAGTGDLRISATNMYITNGADNESKAYFGDNGPVELYYDNSKKFETKSTGVTVFGTLTETSSIDYKENVQPLEFNEAIYNVNAVKYDRKDGSSKDEVGVIAEELYEVLPDLVECKDGKPDAVKYTKMTMYLLEALKKQNQEIQLLKEKLNG